MDTGPLAQLLIERFDAMPSQLQVAARFVLDHPTEVALISMREQAHQAGVSHTTMMRLARWLDLDSYEDMRSLYAKALREPGSWSVEPRNSSDSRNSGGIRPTVELVTGSLATHMARLGEKGNATQFFDAAEILTSSRNVFSLGTRAEYPVAHHLAYVSSLIGRHIIMLDAIGGTGIDALRNAGQGDAVVAVSLAPYSRGTFEIAQLASQRGIKVVAITDSKVSPLARLAKTVIVVATNSEPLFRSVSSAFAAAEVLVALIAERSETNVEETVRNSEALLTGLGVYL
jgi:DNA-binding MurR/RpiR family transcriptional regulator